MWKDGILVVSCHYNAEAIVEKRPEIRAVDIITRGEVAADCQHLLRKLDREVMAMVDEWSPGSCLQHFFLSRKELEKLPSLGSLAAPKVQYAQSRVEEAKREATFVTEEIEKGAGPESIDNLFLLPEEGGGKLSISNWSYTNGKYSFQPIESLDCSSQRTVIELCVPSSSSSEKIISSWNV